MPFKNRIRLPIKVTRPQFESERGVFSKANGETKTQFVNIRKSYEGETDWMPEKLHERLVIALGHDEVTIEGDKYLGGIIQDGEYEIQWQEFLDYPTAKGKFKVRVTPFAALNTNCQSCAEATQVTLEDDTFENAYGGPLDLQEGEEYQLNVADNDDICCYPAVFSLITYNSTYLSSASISQSGVLTINVKTGLVAANGVLLATYRVTCPNGGYDEANVYGNIDGSVIVCLAPQNLEIVNITTNSARGQWTAPSPAPVNGYSWVLYDASNLGSPLQSGGTTDLFVDLTGLDDGTDYILFVESDCIDATSTQVNASFSTPTVSNSCGDYDLIYYDLNGDPAAFTEVTYIDCTGDNVTTIIFHNQSRNICALQLGPNDPVSIVASSPVVISYNGLC
jgi:hypothetical protein